MPTGWQVLALVCAALLVLQTLGLVWRKKRRRDRIVGRVLRAVEGEQASGAPCVRGVVRSAEAAQGLQT